MKKYKNQYSTRYYQAIKQQLPGGVHNNFAVASNSGPIVIEKAINSRVYDYDGNEYLDLYSKYGSLILGHSNEEYINGLKRSLDKPNAIEMPTVSDEVCSQLCRIVPACEMVRFGLSGTEVVGNSLRLARAYSKKQKIIRFVDHYHGSSDHVLGGIPYNENNPYAFDPGNTIFSTQGRATNALGETFLLPWNDIETLKSFIEHNEHEIAAVIMELVMMNSNGNTTDAQYLKQVRKLCSSKNIVLIFDEVITGIRMGLGGVQKAYDVTPDLTIFGKALSNGYLPVTALMGKRDIMGLYENGTVVYGGTYNGYTMGLEAVALTISILSQYDYANRLKQIGNGLCNIISEEAGKAGLHITTHGNAACFFICLKKSENDIYNYLGEEEAFNNYILRTCFASYGILLAPSTRVFVNLGFSDNDFEFFKERVQMAMGDIALILKRYRK